MDIFKLKWTVLQAEIFSLLCQRAGEKLSQREIAKILTVSPTAITNSMKELTESGLIKMQKTKMINFISFNRDEQKAIELKQVENLKNIYLSGLSEYMHTELAGGTIIVFGSYSKGEDTANSDIDLAIIGRKEKKVPLEKYEQMLHRKISLHFYQSWKEIHQHLRNNILNGIILAGSVEL